MGDLGELPTGTVTLLLADIEGSTRLWETQPDVMKAAVERLDHCLAQLVGGHHGVRPVEQGEGDSFVIAFGRALDALTCALELQRAPLAPITLRIGIHTGDVQLRDEGNYIGPTINRTARLRDLAHGGQTVLSGASEALVVDQLPAQSSLIDLGSHPLRDLPRPEHVFQLCHPDVRNTFPPLRTAESRGVERLPAQLTSFIGRRDELVGVRAALTENRLVTLTGAGGAGKTRLAVEVAASAATDFADGLWYVDLAPIVHPEAVPVTALRALGLPDQPGQPPLDLLRRSLANRSALVLLDNCEHLLDASAELITALLGACPNLSILTTSREPIGVPGEVSWRVPSLALADEAIELFIDRARRTRPDFQLTVDNAEAVADICRRLDGLPLAIELAAARVRALSPNEIRDSLHDTFRLLTGGSRTAVRRQQTLRASVDWSYALLSDTEQALFGRLAVFLGGFDIDAARAVADVEAERYQVLDQLTLLVDKSLVVAEDTRLGTRYRLLETMRQYALEKLMESREGDMLRGRHRDHYCALASTLADQVDTSENRVDRVAAEIDNLRAAFAWSLEGGEYEHAQTLVAALMPLWQAGGRIQEGLDWCDAALSDVADYNPTEALVRAWVCEAQLLSFLAQTEGIGEVEHAIALAREFGDPALIIRALAAYGLMGAAYDPERVREYLAEAAELASDTGDLRMLCQIRVSQTVSGLISGGHIAELEAAAEEGLRIAEEIGDEWVQHQARLALAWALHHRGGVAESVARLERLVRDTAAAHDHMYLMYANLLQAFTVSYTGNADLTRQAAEAALREVNARFHYYEGSVRAGLGIAHLVAGDMRAAWESFELGRALTQLDLRTASTFSWAALAPLACGDVAAAVRWADDVAATTRGYGHALTLVTRARVRMAVDDVDAAECDAQVALGAATSVGADIVVPYVLSVLGGVAAAQGDSMRAVRLFGAADTLYARMGVVPFGWLVDADREVLNTIRTTLGGEDFHAAWAEGRALTLDEAVGYAQRGRG